MMTKIALFVLGFSIALILFTFLIVNASTKKTETVHEKKNREKENPPSSAGKKMEYEASDMRLKKRLSGRDDTWVGYSCEVTGMDEGEYLTTLRKKENKSYRYLKKKERGNNVKDIKR